MAKFSNQYKIQKQEIGFTIIELAMVLTLVGVLAAMALPKFANLTTSALTNVNQGLAGSLNTAVNIAHAAWVANTNVSPIKLDCQTANVSLTPTNGWPNLASVCGTAVGAGASCNAATCPANTPTSADCATLWTNIMSGSPKVNVFGTPCAAGTTSNCYLAVGAEAAGGTLGQCLYVLSGLTATTSNVGTIYKITYTMGVASGNNGNVAASP